MELHGCLEAGLTSQDNNAFKNKADLVFYKCTALCKPPLDISCDGYRDVPPCWGLMIGHGFRHPGAKLSSLLSYRLVPWAQLENVNLYEKKKCPKYSDLNKWNVCVAFSLSFCIKAVQVIHVGPRLRVVPRWTFAFCLVLCQPKNVTLVFTKMAQHNLTSAHENGGDPEVVQIIFTYILIGENSHMTTLAARESGTCNP